MKRTLQFFALFMAAVLVVLGSVGAWYVYTKRPVRSGTVGLRKLQAPVSVQYDERGVPHIRAQNEADLYRALGYVHAQDRLFQMEIVRRLANGELAEILGPKLLDSDKLMRTLGMRAKAAEFAARTDMASPANLALLAYLDGINQYQASHKPPMEFDILRIPKRPFTPQDTAAVSGYLAYSFAAAIKTEPVLTYVRDKLGADYLRAFDVDWHPEGVIGATAPNTAFASTLSDKDWQGLSQLAAISQDAVDMAGLPFFEGSNAWAISGKRTASGKPLLAGDPHIGYSAPAVWYEAHLSAPGFELYGHYQALNPMALLGHNTQFGWTLTMFQNDDMDLVAEKINPANPQQVWHKDQWVDLQTRTETIVVKGAAPVKLTLRSSPHGPLINEVFKESLGTTPIALWWAMQETDNPVLEAFYALNRADTLDKARTAASTIHAPGLNIVWASAKGDIAWWAAAKLPIRPPSVNPTFILDAEKGEADKLGFYNFSFNPQEENPPRGYIVSANNQPTPRSGVPVPGYYNLPDRLQRLDLTLRDPERKWTVADAQALQLDTGNGYAPRVLAELLPVLASVATAPTDKPLVELLQKWDGNYSRESLAATLFTQLLYETAHAAMADELGAAQFKNLLRTRAIDTAMPLLIADAASPWWDNSTTPQKETRADIVRRAWSNALAHLDAVYASSLQARSWGKAHTLTHNHPLGVQKPLDYLFSVGAFPVSGARETPNNMANHMGPAPWAVVAGPSTRRVIDFGDATKSVGINPLGQSGVLFDRHYADQAERFVVGLYVPQHISTADVNAHTKSTLTLRPAP